MPRTAKTNRLRIPPNPARDTTATRMLVRQTPLTVVAVESEGWSCVPNLAQATERCAFHVKLSDGRVLDRDAEVTYAEGERERILEAVVRQTGTASEVRAMQQVLFRRATAVQSVYGSLHREFGQLPATTRTEGAA